MLASRPALALLSALEFQAVVAHEIGHDYFWEEERDVHDKAPYARRQLELRCDAIAVLTLLQLDLDPTSVVSALRKLARFNDTFGMRIDASQYPSTIEREQFARALVDLVRSRGLATTGSSNVLPERMLSVAGSVHFSHSARPEVGNDLVRSDVGRGDKHGCGL